MAASAGQLNSGFVDDLDIQLEVRGSGDASSQTAAKTTTTSIEVTAVDDKLWKEQRHAMADEAAAATTHQYVDEPPSYSVFVIGGGTPLGHGSGHTQCPEESRFGPAANKTKTALLSTGAGCRGCQLKKQMAGSCDEEDEQRVDKKSSCANDPVIGQDYSDDSFLEIKAWKQFTSNTTMHGIKYVFEDRPFTLRR
jgi:hypothetical protein